MAHTRKPGMPALRRLRQDSSIQGQLGCVVIPSQTPPTREHTIHTNIKLWARGMEQMELSRIEMEPSFNRKTSHNWKTDFVAVTTL